MSPIMFGYIRQRSLAAPVTFFPTPSASVLRKVCLLRRMRNHYEVSAVSTVRNTISRAGRFATFNLVVIGQLHRLHFECTYVPLNKASLIFAQLEHHWLHFLLHFQVSELLYISDVIFTYILTNPNNIQKIV